MLHTYLSNKYLVSLYFYQLCSSSTQLSGGPALYIEHTPSTASNASPIWHNSLCAIVVTLTLDSTRTATSSYLSDPESTIATPNEGLATSLHAADNGT